MNVAIAPTRKSSTPAPPGRKPAEETIPERVEGCLYGVTYELVGARRGLDAAPTHDALADQAVRLIGGVAHLLLGHGDPDVRQKARAILIYCRDYQRHDGAEDAHVATATTRVDAARREARTGAALIEMASTGTARGARTKRQTPADQPLLMVEG